MDPWIIGGLLIATLSLAGIVFAIIETMTNIRDKYDDDESWW